MSVADINQKEYLKKYMSPQETMKKRKKLKSKKKLKVGKTKIIDDDLDLVSFTKCVSEDMQQDEDAPQIVAVQDDRPLAMRSFEHEKKPMWRPVITVNSDDESPERTPHIKTEPLSPSRGSDSDQSPLGNSRDHISEKSPGRINPQKRDDCHKLSRKRRDSDSSPPRKHKRNPSPVSRRDRDINPPRRSQDEDDSSPPRRRERKDSTPPKRTRNKDLSPPRRRGAADSSPPRRSQNQDSSPPRRNRKDNSPPRRSKTTSSDRSPLQHKHGMSSNRSRGTAGTSRWAGDDNDSERPMTSKSKESTDFSLMGPPKTIMRDRKTGRIRDLADEARQAAQKSKAEDAMKEQYLRWGKGLSQVEKAEQQRADDQHEMQKPFARYADDADLDRMLRERERDGDPMLQYLRKKKRERNKEAGIEEKPQYQGIDGPPNRYNIRPGYRWDGVDRSNGYEKKLFEMRNARIADQEDAYKWSSEDM